MAVRRFIPYPDPRLKAVSAEVEGVDDKIVALWQDMLDSMYAMPGVGLAACQIGENLRLAVVDCSEGKDQPLRMANPEILHASGKFSTHEEGSPNLPGVWAEIKRPRAILARFMDETGTVVEKDFVGLWATSVQHQIDHMNGKMFFDHLSPVKRKMLLAKAQKLARRKG